jgi:hypothetical protein
MAIDLNPFKRLLVENGFSGGMDSSLAVIERDAKEFEASSVLSKISAFRFSQNLVSGFLIMEHSGL